MNDVFYTPKEIAKILKVSYDSALSWIKTSGIEYTQIGKQYRVSVKAFEDMLVGGKKDIPRQITRRPIYEIRVQD